ncbi:COG3747 Phage terminase, small subunit [uncultured Caudovirales phage]|uniref:COG3747 Phage terminase, small subunit n=1 Tax=uncultured Caudovirales phage TaxID=2100421 RepID=A0A6J5SU01_9CAUD|nr:COG3747 Phage terminase, small subunit [uncultured Caudovirales phage]
MWLRLVAELAPRGLRDHDLDGITMLCQAVHIHREAQDGIAKHGVLVKGQRGPMVNPLVKVARDQAMFILRIMNEYGLTPAARVRLGLQTLAAHSMVEALNNQLDASPDLALKVLGATNDRA